MDQQYRALYAAFDPYPSPKGAATHIRYFSETLFRQWGGGVLYTLGATDQPASETEGNLRYERFNLPLKNYLQRAEAFAERLAHLRDALDKLEMVHFRDIWSGMALLTPDRAYATVFEVNGLPSIELPYRYADLPENTLNKIDQLEQHCLQHADHIVVPSKVIEQHLLNRGLPESKITWIPNGAVLPPVFERPEDAPEQYLIYFGALQPWQGIDILLKALPYLQDFSKLKLIICAAHHRHFVKPYRKLAEKLGVEDRLIWKFRLEQEELWAYVQHAKLSLAPLKECSRNLEQGCCPLKILESMACGTTVVASDLPVVRELVQNGMNAKLVKADRPAELARAVRVLLDYPEESSKLSQNALSSVRGQFSWTDQQAKLAKLYQTIINHRMQHV
ncbi:glycosyltransferase [Catalinimonas sp. 4WD22]|uniref:glycosyltransferase family 4 protein n=1 Tax=Catalinimonas locisalis TaxID=3133978 RepID=UPI003100CAA3